MTKPTLVVHGQVRELERPDFTDAQVASMVRGLMRNQMNHEFVCTLSRDRILYLSQRLERAETILKGLFALTDVGWGPQEDKVNAFLSEPKTVPSLTANLMDRA